MQTEYPLENLLLVLFQKKIHLCIMSEGNLTLIHRYQTTTHRTNSECLSSTVIVRQLSDINESF